MTRTKVMGFRCPLHPEVFMKRDRLFVPLNKHWYDLFANGKKKWEIRGVGPLFNSGTVRIGRDVELRRGYAKEGALWGTITDIIITRHVYDVPLKVKKELFPISMNSPLWGEIDTYNTKYGEFIVFKVRLM